MKSLTQILTDRLNQLENRKMMIPRYVKNPLSFIGKKDFSLNDMPKLEEQIQETKAAIRGIDEWKRSKKEKTIPQ